VVAVVVISSSSHIANINLPKEESWNSAVGVVKVGYWRSPGIHHSTRENNFTSCNFS